MVSVATVEKYGFQKLLRTIDPKYVIPSRKYFAEEALPKLYNEVKEKILNQLQNVRHFSTTSDLWTSRAMQPYMSLTVHFIENWEIRSVCLQTGFAPDDHTRETIALGRMAPSRGARLTSGNMLFYFSFKFFFNIECTLNLFCYI
ncbi:ZBED1 protein, partial [Polypterus senegalus]